MGDKTDTNRKNKVMIIGIDQAIPGLIDQFIEEGNLPAIEKLAEEGVKTTAFSCPPCDTPTNWTTISTGATTGVHGCTSFYPHAVGEDFGMGLKYRSRSMLSSFCQADYIWDAADREGLKSFVINYPSGWPGTMKNGVICTYTWNIPETPKRVLRNGTKIRYKADHKSDLRKLKVVDDDSVLQEKLKSKLNPIKLCVGVKSGTSPITAYLTGDENYDEFVYGSQSETGINAGFKHIPFNEWSDFITDEVRVNKNGENKAVKCLYKVKVTYLDESLQKATVEYSSVYSVDSWVNPPKYAEGLIRNALAEEVHYSEDVEYMIDGSLDDFLDEANSECRGIVKALEYMKNEIDWDFAIFHVHFLDTVNHYSLGYLYEKSPLNDSDPDYVEHAKKNVRVAYQIIDDMVGNIMDHVVDEDTTVIFLSDHGAIPVWKTVNLPPVFAGAGLTNYKFKDNKFVVDWSKTKAFPYFEPHYIWVNKKGRDPDGIVADEEYEHVRDEIIHLLEGLKDPETDEKIMRAVFRREEAAFLGQDGERVGDVVYFMNPPYQVFDGATSQLDATELNPYEWTQTFVRTSKVCYGAHAYYLPTEKVGKYSVSVPLIISGPGIDKNAELRSPINLIDIAPTVAEILGIKRPKNAQGRTLHEILK